MALLEIIAAVILLLIATIIILNKPKKISAKEIPVAQAKTPEPVTQKLVIKEIEKSTANTESSAQTLQTTASLPKNNSSLPEDSILKRHYLAHLSSMIESLACPRPTDSVLCRHYEAMTAEKIAQCLNNKPAMAQLVNDFEHNKSVVNVEPVVARQADEPRIFAPELGSNLVPEDSILRRHYLTHLRTLLESLAFPRPTDSVLCRHYDTMMVAKLDQCLNNG